MTRAPLLAFCLFSVLASSPAAFAADSVKSTVPGPDSTGPTNPTPPTLPTPGTGIDHGTGTGIDGPDSAPTPGTDGTGREEQKGKAGPTDNGNLPGSKTDQTKNEVPGS